MEEEKLLDESPRLATEPHADRTGAFYAAAPVD
jgi:hypothetical protein